MDSKGNCDLDATPANATAAHLPDLITIVANSAAVVSNSGAMLANGESTTIPMSTPVTRRIKRVCNSKAELAKAVDGNLACTVSTSDLENAFCSETVIAIKSESAETVETETLASSETQSHSSSPRKHRLRHKNSSELIPEKRARSSKSEEKHSPASAPSSAEKFQASHSVSKKLRKKLREVSESLSLELKWNEDKGSIIHDTSNSDMNLTQNHDISESKESVIAETLGCPKGGQSPGRGKNVRNPYGRWGKAGKHSTTAIHPTMKLVKSSVPAALPVKTKVDPVEAGAVRPEWLKPFAEGWRREIVFRNSAADATGGRKCDIYYFAPDSCKLRSIPQIVSYLLKQKSDLTISCFTFVKRMIYMEPAEFVRNAIRRSDVTTSTKLPKPPKRKKETERRDPENAGATKPSLKLKLKKSLMKVKIVGIMGGEDVSLPIPIENVFKEELHFHATPLISATEAQSLADSLPMSPLDVSGSSQWKLMKPKKIFRKKESSALPMSMKNESEQVAEAGEAYPPPEMPGEAPVPSSETMQLPAVDTNQSEINTLLKSTVDNEGISINKDNRVNGSIVNEDNENAENEDDDNAENEDNEDKDNENIEDKDNENIENKDNENIEDKDNENIENEDNENIENKDNENIENKDNENAENKDNESFGNEDIENDSRLLPIPKSVASVKVFNVGHVRTLNKNRSTGRPVAKKSPSKRGGKLGRKVERITMLYTKGLPQREVNRRTNAWLGLDANDVSVTRSGLMPVKPTVDSKTSPNATDDWKNKSTDRNYYDPSYNPISEIRRCGLHCAGRYGMAPSLHCDICMCMFHPECVDITHIPHRTSFTCQACYSLNADFSGSNSFSDHTVVVPLNSRPVPPPSGRPGDRLNALDARSSSSFPLSSCSSLGAFGSSFTLPPVATALSKVSVSGIDRASPSGRVLSLPLSVASRLNLSQPVTLSFDGQKYSVPGSCFIVTPDSVKVLLPNHIFTGSGAPKTVAPSNALLSSAPSAFNPDDETNASLPNRDLDALQMTSTEASSKASSSERNCAMRSSREATQSNDDSTERLQRVEQSRNNGQRQPMSDGQTTQLTNETNDGRDEVAMDVSGNDVGSGMEESDSGKGGSSCFEWIQSNVELMLCIFKRLNIVDLLNASRVCAEWRRISGHSLLVNIYGRTTMALAEQLCMKDLMKVPTGRASPPSRFLDEEALHLWMSVDLSGVKVIDWSLAAEQMTRHQTKSLNLRRLVHCGSENQTWHQLTAAFSSLTTVRCLVFGSCPANLVYVAASKMADLESLKANEIVDGGNGENSANSQTTVRLRSTKLDVGKMAVLRNLVHLELRGSYGLILPAFSFSGGLTELAQLTQLKHLSITSLRDVPGKEFRFLDCLENLEVLDIGDCKLWTKEDYDHVGRLTQLKRLKLESVLDSEETGLGLALANLSQLEHLELSSFRISKSSADSLSTMFQLKALHLHSDTSEETETSNSHVLTAVKRMKFLTKLTWTILPHSHRQTRPSNDDDDDNRGSSAEHPQPEERLPFLMETGLGDSGGGGGGKESSAVEWKSIGELESILNEGLAASTDVYSVAAHQATDSS